MLLELHKVTKHFMGLVAVDDFNMDVDRGELVGLIGPNGAGKTTLFNLITGILRLTSGKITFNGIDITEKRPHEVAELGIGRTFQLNPLFSDFTVLENMIASFHLRPKSSLPDVFFNTATYRRNEADIKEQSLQILNLLGLDKVKNELGKHLPHGHRLILGIARALAVKPKLLLLDEPTRGMSLYEIDLALGAIERMCEQGVTIVLVEHNMEVIDFCDRVVVMNFGKKIAEGPVDQVRKNEEVIKAYLGSAHAA
jgi:branched-chain amino acid transport system ATP-binding protein